MKKEYKKKERKKERKQNKNESESMREEEQGLLVLTGNRAHAHDRRDKVDPPIPHLRRIIAVVGMETEAHV